MQLLRKNHHHHHHLVDHLPRVVIRKNPKNQKNPNLKSPQRKNDEDVIRQHQVAQAAQVLHQVLQNLKMIDGIAVGVLQVVVISDTEVGLVIHIDLAIHIALIGQDHVIVVDAIEGTKLCLFQLLVYQVYFFGSPKFIPKYNFSF